MNRILYIIAIFAILPSAAQQPRLMIPIGHNYQVKSAFFTEKDKYAITYSENVKIWEASTGKLVKNITHASQPSEAHMLPDNETLVIAYPDSIRIWNINQDKIIRTFAGNNINVFDSTNTMMVMQFDDYDLSIKRNATLYDIKTGKQLHQFDQPIATWSEASNRFIAINFNTVRLYDASFKPVYESNDGNLAGISNDFQYLALQKDTSLEIIDMLSQKVLQTFSTDNISSYSVKFFPASRNMVIHITPMKSDRGFTGQSDDSYLIGFDLDSFKVNNRFPEQKGNIVGTDITKDFIASSHADSTIRIWEARTGNLLSEIKDSTGISNHIAFSNDRKSIIASSNSTAAKIWDIEKRKLKIQLDPHSGYISNLHFTGDGKLLLMQRGDDIWLWDVEKGVPALTVKGNPLQSVFSTFLDQGSSRLFLQVQDKGTTTMEKGGAISFTLAEQRNKYLDVYELVSGKRIQHILLPAKFDKMAVSPDGKEAVITLTDNSAFILDINSAKKSRDFKHLEEQASRVFYVPGKEQVAIVADSSFILYQSTTLQPLMKITEKEPLSAFGFSPESGIGLSITSTKNIYLREIKTGRLITAIQAYHEKDKRYAFTDLYAPAIDSQGRYFAIKTPGNPDIIILDAKTPGSYKHIARTNYPNTLFFNNQNLLVVTYINGVFEEWDPATQKIIRSGKFDTEYLDAFNPGETIAAGHRNSEISFFDNTTKKLKHRLHILPGDDYIITDLQNRYDGSEAARKKLYFTCGTEIIELEQLKDQLWVPGLAARIIKGEPINAKSLDDLGICGLTPLAETIGRTNKHYQFRITPRRGGLGETILQVNGIEISRYPIARLRKTGNSYLLEVERTEIEKYFIPGVENSVAVRAMTASNNISSRSTVIDEEATEKNTDPPNLYAVIVGVSDYKGDGLDLQYAAKDAKDFANAIEMTAGKLLNSQEDHVFVYRIHTDEGRDKFPEKKSIQEVFAEIGKKAKPNDVLLVFFAGHGKMDKDTRQFHFITADASKTTITNSLSDVSISTRELTEWIRPSVMKAQKRILIFDACNSGQAINDLVKIGEGDQQFIAARDDEQAEQVKAIEKMNEKSGLFILSASASDQKAYEMSRYSQGVLTYSLLQAIKLQPEILNRQKFLDVTRWFAAAEKSVSEIARESNAPQQAQIVSTTNFDIGIVDEDIRQKIILPLEKPVFTSAEFRNSELKFDNLKFRNLVDGKLAGNSSSSGVLFRPAYPGSDTYMISGDYKIEGGQVSVSAMLIKGGTSVMDQFELKGSADNLDQLASAVVERVIKALAKKQENSSLKG